MRSPRTLQTIRLVCDTLERKEEVYRRKQDVLAELQRSFFTVPQGWHEFAVSSVYALVSQYLSFQVKIKTKQIIENNPNEPKPWVPERPLFLLSLFLLLLLLLIGQWVSHQGNELSFDKVRGTV